MNSGQWTRGRSRALPEEVPVGYKRTEVGVIPQEWDIVALRNIIDKFVNGGTPSTKNAAFWSGDIPWITGADILNQTVAVIRRHITEEAIHNSSTSVIAKGNLLIVSRTGVGKLAIAPCDIAISQDFTGVIPNKEKILAKYLFRYFDFCQHVLAKQNQGTSIKGITRDTLAAILLPLPPPSEQRAIAAALFDMDGLLAALEALIAKKRAIKQAAMQELLTGKTRLPGFSGAWETKRLGELGSFSKGRGIKRQDVSDTGLPCIRYGELYTRYKDYILNPVSRIPPAVALEALPIKKGDLLFAGSGETAEEIGICAAYLGEEPAYAGGDVITLTPSGQNSIYLGHLMNYPTVATQKARMGQGDAVVHISASNLAQVKIELPPLTEQTAIATILSDMDAEIAALERRRDKTRAVKQGMMQQLLTGRVRLVESE